MRSLGIIIYSKVRDDEECSTVAGNLLSLFDHIIPGDCIRRVYFVDDSASQFRSALSELLSRCVAEATPAAEIVPITDSGHISTAVNRVWTTLDEEYILSVNSDFRMIQTIPLDVVLTAFESYPDIYLLNLKTRLLFGYHDTGQDILRETYPWYCGHPDGLKETWFCRDEEGRVYSVPCELFQLQRNRSRLLPKEQWGVELIPRPIDSQNTLWTPKLPTKLLPVWPAHTRFIGGQAVYRTEVVKRYLPLPAKYGRLSPADCKETYFWTTDVDSKYSSGYLNLQVFCVPFGDRKKWSHDVEAKYWEIFRQNNSQSITQEKRGVGKPTRSSRTLRLLLLTPWRHTFNLRMRPWLVRYERFRRQTGAEKRRSGRRYFERAFHRILPWCPLPVRLPGGIWWLAWNDSRGRLVLENGLKPGEEAERRFMDQVLRPGMRVVDIGAHHGYCTLLASKKVGPTGWVAAFEPSIRERKRLNWHLRLNRCKNVCVEDAAVGSTEGEANLFVVDGYATGANSLRPPNVNEPTRKMRVRVRTIDNYLQSKLVQHVDFLKIDAEGAELGILRGAELLIRRKPRPLILCEVADVRTEPWGYEGKDIVWFLTDHGFRWFKPTPDGSLEPLPDDRHQFIGPDYNFVAVPEERLEGTARWGRIPLEPDGR